MVGDWNVYPKVYTQLRPFIVKNWSHDMFYRCTQQVFLILIVIFVLSFTDLLFTLILKYSLHNIIMTYEYKKTR